MTYFFLLGVVFMGYSTYMLQYNRLCKNGPAVNIAYAVIRSVGIYRDGFWHIVFAGYDLPGEDRDADRGVNSNKMPSWLANKNEKFYLFDAWFGESKIAHTRIGPDYRSSWFARESDAVDLLNKLKSVTHTRVNIFGSHMLISELPKHRKENYLSVFIAGLIFIVLGIGLGWLQYSNQ